MTNAEEQLAAIGFAPRRRDPVCWRAERLARPARRQRRPRPAREPGDSPALRYWRDLLAKSPVPPGYRISRIAG